MTAQTYITIVLVAILFAILFGIYIASRENNYSWHVRKVQDNIARRLQDVVPNACIDKVVDIISEELELLMKG